MTAGFRRRLVEIHRSLAIPEDFLRTCRLPMQVEASDLCSAGPDVYGREQQMTATTLICWQAMQKAALDEGIVLSLVSAFRSLDYQCDLIRAKLTRGESMEDILQVNAAPGFSEHHTGCALDLTTLEVEPLTEAFEETPAFQWLLVHGTDFDFILSYPRNNPFGILYEPWHWLCRSQGDC